MNEKSTKPEHPFKGLNRSLHILNLFIHDQYRPKASADIIRCPDDLKSALGLAIGFICVVKEKNRMKKQILAWANDPSEVDPDSCEEEIS